MSKEKNNSVELLPEPVKQYFLDSIDERLHTHAKQHLHAIDIAAQELLTHHLEFEMDRLKLEEEDNPNLEEGRLAIIYSNCNSFGLLKKAYKDAERHLEQINPTTAKQVILHIEDNIDIILSEMVDKKRLEIGAKHPFRTSIGTPKHIH